MTITLTFDETVERVRSILAATPEGLNPQRSTDGGCQYTRDHNTIDRPNTLDHCVMGQFLVDLGQDAPPGDDTTLVAIILRERALDFDSETIEFLQILQTAADGQYVWALWATSNPPEEEYEDLGINVRPREWGTLLAHVDALAAKVKAPSL